MPALRVHSRDALVIVFRWREGSRRVGKVEGILDFTRGVLLWDEQGVEAPKAGFNEGGRGHFCEAGSGIESQMIAWEGGVKYI